MRPSGVSRQTTSPTAGPTPSAKLAVSGLDSADAKRRFWHPYTMGAPRRDCCLAPATGDDTDVVVEAAIENLGKLRDLPWLGDASARLHLLASLTAEAERRLPRAVADARDQECSWAQIGDLLGVTRASAWQRYRGRTAKNHTPRDPD
jgi:hypothetical protein